MTSIVAVETAEGVWMGADSWGGSNGTGLLREDPKIFSTEHYLIGFTTSYRFGQLVRYKGLTAPWGNPHDTDTDDLFEFMATEFVDGIRTALKDGGWLTKEKEQEEGGDLLVALGGRLFFLAADFQVGRAMNGYDTCGSGYAAARGSFVTTELIGGKEPVDRVTLALESAARHCTGVAPPFHLFVQYRTRSETGNDAGGE